MPEENEGGRGGVRAMRQGRDRMTGRRREAEGGAVRTVRQRRVKTIEAEELSIRATTRSMGMW